MAALDRDVDGFFDKRRWLMDRSRQKRSDMSKLRIPSEANTAAWFFLAPALALIGVFFFLPVAASLLLSVTDFDLYGIADPANTRFVGFDNYARLLKTPDFWLALRNTFYFAFVGGPLTIAVSLGAALLLSSKLVRFKGFFRTIYFTPVRDDARRRRDRVALPLSHALRPLQLRARRTSASGRSTGSAIRNWAMPAIILMAVWKSFGYNMLIFIAGLQAIPEELYDAARDRRRRRVAQILQHHASDARADTRVRRASLR